MTIVLVAHENGKYDEYIAKLEAAIMRVHGLHLVGKRNAGMLNIDDLK